MKLWGHLSRGLRRLMHADRAHQDVTDEVADFYERQVAEFERAGLTAEEARRRARAEMGSDLSARETVGDYGWEQLVGALLSDIRFALRLLSRRPAFALFTILTLGLGVGATTAVFSVAYPILFQPLPYPDDGRVVLVSQRNSAEGELGRMGYATAMELAPAVPAFAHVAASDRWSATITEGAEPEMVPGQFVTWGFFRALGVPPAIGGDFRQDQDLPNAATVVIISDGLWRRRFAHDPGIIGRSIQVNGQSALIIGVMPRGFESPLAQDAEIWAPRGFDVNSPGACRFCRHMQVIARIRPEASVGEATGQLDRLYESLKRQYPDAYRETRFPVTPLRSYMSRDVRGVLLTVLGAVALVLLIACVNVTNLLLARGAERRAEFAVRTALGAGRSRLVRQMLTESMIIALLGGLVGVTIALAGMPALLALAPPGLPLAGTIGINGAVLAFALTLTTTVGIVFGLIPAFHVSRDRLAHDMQGASRRISGKRTRGALVIAEVALALMLLVGSGLLLRSERRVLQVPPGFDPSNVLTMRLLLANPRFSTANIVWSYYDQILVAVRAVPGVESAALTSQLPLSGDLDQYGIHGEVEAGGSERTEHPGFRYAVSDDYLETLRIPIVRGRGLDASAASGDLFAVINETAARTGWRGKDPIGQRVHVGPDQGPWYTIVGITGDVRQASLMIPPDNEIYVPERGGIFGDATMSLVVRTKSDPATMTAAVRRAIWSVDPSQAVERVATMSALRDRSAAKQRFALVLFEVFGALALVLAAAGIYGILAGRVAERTREIGIRTALGASGLATIGWVLKQGAVITGVGLLVGLAAAAGLSRLLTALLYGTTPLDPGTYVVVTLVLAAVALFACWVPAMRAARIDPAITLRAE